MLLNHSLEFGDSSNRVDHIDYAAQGIVDRSGGHIDQKAFLAVYLFDVRSDLSDYLASGFRAYPVDDLNQHIHQSINQLRPPRH